MYEFVLVTATPFTCYIVAMGGSRSYGTLLLYHSDNSLIKAPARCAMQRSGKLDT